MEYEYTAMGSMLRCGWRQTHFAPQLKKYADTYTYNVCNLYEYSPSFYFSPIPLLPHEYKFVKALSRLSNEKSEESIPSEVDMSGSLIGLLLLTCVLAIVAKDVNTNRKKTYGDLDIVPCKKFPPCPKGYYCVEGSFSCFYDDTCEVIPTECQPLSCPDILGCDVPCPQNMHRKECYPLCEEDCQGRYDISMQPLEQPNPCAGKQIYQCNPLKKCVCKPGFVLVTRNLRRLGCIKKKECDCAYDFN
ncbi:hypothetical protein Q1695_004569 [Nippostrongylus brasiliensis]|nr:hypothetical protein Q1695_004569 [Nippostrongylus brasiliensis]